MAGAEADERGQVHQSKWTRGVALEMVQHLHDPGSIVSSNRHVPATQVSGDAEHAGGDFESYFLKRGVAVQG